MTLWKGLRGSSALFSVNQRNLSLSVTHQQRLKLRGLYFKLGEWTSAEDFGSSPLFSLRSAALSSQLCKHRMGRSTLKKRKDTECQGQELEPKETKKMFFCHGSFVRASAYSWLMWNELPADHCCWCGSLFDHLVVLLSHSEMGAFSVKSWEATKIYST